MEKVNNPAGILGFDFIEFSSSQPEKLHQLFVDLGFSKLMTHKDKKIDYYNQNDIHFFINTEPNSFAAQFLMEHGPCASSTGWRVKNAQDAYNHAVSKGAIPAEIVDYSTGGKNVPAVKGVGDSLIYFIDDFNEENRFEKMGFIAIENPQISPSKGFNLIDHLTNNVKRGCLEPLSDYYKNVYGFTEVRHFDIDGKQTGLMSYALRSPCGSFCIPINESKDEKSQIQEYINEYRGEGIQHIAFLTPNIVKSMDSISQNKCFDTLDIDDEYYSEIFNKFPQVNKDKDKIIEHNLLVDGDDDGYLVQIFTKNTIGPIFFEFIQRRNHLGFGEGNFGALFRSIERDQEKRGVL